MNAYRFSIYFHLALFAVIYMVAAFGGSALADDVEPYEGRIATPRAQIRSGPGETFYPTDTLVSGETVEVYREEADGWLAIRPPEKSFSWVMERQLKLRDDGFAEVDDASVASRIGSRLSDARNAAQVKLKKGEVVEVLDTLELDGQSWCKIAPPAGEFRWVHATCVQLVGPITEADAEGAAAEPDDVVTASATTEAPKGDASTKAPPAPVSNATAESVAIPMDAAPLASAPAAAPGDRWRSPGASATAVGAEVVAPPLTPIASAPPTPNPVSQATSVPPQPTPITPLAAAPAGELQRQLIDIEMRLSRMASASPHLWNTERLERDTEQLLAQAQSDAERNAVKVTLAKIDQFKLLGRRYQQGAGSMEPGAGAVASAPIVAANVPAGEEGRYDAVGILRPVVSKRPGAPQFALVDERGQVVSFVTPTPDVNLRPYLGRRVGIAGNRGFIPEFNRAHVTAGRVTPLAQGMVR
jgi:SH3-like domain-containing protein